MAGITSRGQNVFTGIDSAGNNVFSDNVTSSGDNVFGTTSGSAEILYGTAKSASQSMGSLNIRHPLDGSVQSQSNANGVLTISQTLSGQSKGVSTSSGDLTVSHPLQAAANSRSNASGILSTTTDIILYAKAQSISQAVAILSVAHSLSGSTKSASSGIGDLTHAVPLGAFVISKSESSGILSTLNVTQIVERITLKAQRTLKVQLQAQRSMKVTLNAERTLHITLRGGTMTAINQNFTMYQGEKKEIDFPATEDDGSPINFTGLNVKWILKKYVTSATTPVTKSSMDGGISVSSGLATANLVQADTAGLAPGPYYHELKIEDTNSVLATGTCTINPSGA